MKRDFSIRLSLVVMVTLLVLYWITLLLQNPLPAYGKQTIEYVVVDANAQLAYSNYRLTPSQNLERILNLYGSKGWRLVGRIRPENFLIFRSF